MVDQISENPAPEMRHRFLSDISHAARTVDIVTIDGSAEHSGMIVSATLSVSTDPPPKKIDGNGYAYNIRIQPHRKSSKTAFF